MVYIQAKSISKVVEIPAARVAMDRDRCKWRKKLSSLCGMVSNTTPPLVDRTLPQRETPRITRDSSATITSDTPHPPHISGFLHSKFRASMEVEILYVVQDWYEDTDFARVVASSRHLARFGEGPMAQSYAYFRHSGKQKREFGRRSHRILQSWSPKIGSRRTSK